MTGKRQFPADLQLIGFDVDGVFTDGRFSLSDDGIESKSFSTQDGFGIRQVLGAGIAVVVISGRQSRAVDRRMNELGVTRVFQGCKDKVSAFDSVVAELNITVNEAAFVGDDVPDLPLLRHAGFAVAVANAVPAVKSECDMITVASGGAGAVREICEVILSSADAGRR